MSWKFYARIYEIAKISVILEHRDLNANSESLNANSKGLNANSSSFDANLENLNDSERLNANQHILGNTIKSFEITKRYKNKSLI